MNKSIKIKYWPGSPELEKIEKGNWIDLYTYEDVTLQKGDFAIIPLGVAMKLPRGYEAIIASRSSTFKRWGVLQTNAIGVIDSEYCGNDDQWGYPAFATQAVMIPKGTRLCQFRIQESQPDIIFDAVDSLNDKSRGGFGSTGA
jgi:dUTP pyrophosphatase